MKKIVKIIIISFLIISCSQEEDFNQENSSLLGFKKITYTNANSRNITQILEFDNMDIYQQTLASLEQAVEDWDDAFVNQYDYLNDEDLNNKEEELKFDDEKPLTDFENQNNFYSLRNKYYAEEEVWLNHEVLDDTKNPNNKNIYDFDEAEMALMNPDGEIKIGGKIYKYLEIGTLKIQDGDLTKLIRYNNGDTTVLNDPNVDFVENSRTNSCSGWKSRGRNRYYSSNKKMYRKVKIRTFSSFYTKVKAKMISYKKRRHRWRRYRRRLTVGVQTYDFCSNISKHQWSGWKRRRRKKLKRTMTLWNNSASLRAKRYQPSVVGYYKYSNINGDFLQLTW